LQLLLTQHGGLIESALRLYGETNTTDEKAFGTVLLATLPDLCAEIIAIASDEPDLADKAKRLPAPTQLNALSQIFEITFVEPGSVTRFFGQLASLLQQIPKAVNPSSVVFMSASQGTTLSS
jgi:hypothetical protein